MPINFVWVCYSSMWTRILNFDNSSKNKNFSVQFSSATASSFINCVSKQIICIELKVRGINVWMGLDRHIKSDMKTPKILRFKHYFRIHRSDSQSQRDYPREFLHWICSIDIFDTFTAAINIQMISHSQNPTN